VSVLREAAPNGIREAMSALHARLAVTMPIPFILLVLLIPSLIWAFVTFDNLIKLEYHDFYDQWVKDRQPSGMFWKPERQSYFESFRSGTTSQKYMFVWLFKTPEWIAGNDEASRLLKRLRVLVLVWNIGVLVVFCSLFVVMGK
jgi:hypothetical protein